MTRRQFGAGVRMQTSFGDTPAMRCLLAFLATHAGAQVTFFYTYTLADNGTDHVLQTLYRTQAEADAAAQTDAAILANTGAVAIPDAAQKGWVWDVSESEWRPQATKDTGTAPLVAERRRVLVRNLPAHQAQAELDVWGVVEAQLEISYARWIEANTRVASVDANLPDDALYALLLAETQIDGTGSSPHGRGTISP